MAGSDRTILILGGGIVGLCCALRLRREGYETTIVDPDDFAGSASSGNAGHIAIEQVEPLASPAMLRSALGRLTIFGGPLSLPLREIGHWARFAQAWRQAATPDAFAAGKTILGGLLAAAMPAWRRLAGDLSRPDLLRERGHVIVWQNARRAARDIASWERAETGTARFHRATPLELETLGASLRLPLAGALIFENTGQIADLSDLFTALTHAYDTAGGRKINGRARSMAIDQGRTAITLDDGSRIVPAATLVAAGVGSGRLLRGLDQAVPIIAERGYHIQVPHHDWPADLPPVVFQERSIILTRFESGLRIAGFAEFGRADAPPDPGKWARLQRHASALGIDMPAPLTRWVGSRPTLPDYLPAIGRIGDRPDVFYAFGHQHLGLTLAPITAELVTGLIGGRAVPDGLSLSRFNPR